MLESPVLYFHQINKQTKTTLSSEYTQYGEQPSLISFRETVILVNTKCIYNLSSAKMNTDEYFIRKIDPFEQFHTYAS